jgi:prophage antirepressor-like protein
MNNQIIPFDFENKTVRTVVAAGIPWFVAKDVCNVLELSKYRTILETTRKDSNGRNYINFPEDEKGVHDLGHPSGGNQKTLCVNEPGLYRLIHRAHTPEAERFKHKVYHEVLPQIRKTGALVPEGMAVVRKDVLDQMCDRLGETIQEVLRLNKVVAALSQPQIDLKQMKEDIAEIKSEQSLVRYLIDKNEKLQRRGTRLSEDERRDIWFKYRIGMKVAQIERETGRDASSIRRIIKSGKGGAV